jgi:hypothetical protein
VSHYGYGHPLLFGKGRQWGERHAHILVFVRVGVTEVCHQRVNHQKPRANVLAGEV